MLRLRDRELGRRRRCPQTGTAVTRFPVRLSERTEDGWRLQVEVPRTSRFFEGHFPGEPILSGVAQLVLVSEAIEHCTGAPGNVVGLTSVRFRSPVRPGDRLVVSLRRSSKGTDLSFELRRDQELVTNGRLEATP